MEELHYARLVLLLLVVFQAHQAFGGLVSDVINHGSELLELQIFQHGLVFLKNLRLEELLKRMLLSVQPHVHLIVVEQHGHPFMDLAEITEALLRADHQLIVLRVQRTQ